MPSLWFVVPAHGRVDLARVCLTQLRRTCDTLTANGVDASAVVVADDENLETARALGFATVPRDNRWLSRKFNDGIQLALDRDINPRPADYVVPCGSDDWVDWRLFLELPDNHTMFGFQHMSFVSESGHKLTTHHIGYEGGCGIRIYPREMMARAPVPFRPADENREKGCDTSILINLRNTGALQNVVHPDCDPLQIVDWKSRTDQVTSYMEVRLRHRPLARKDPFLVLADRFPVEALEDMARHHAAARKLVAA